MSNTMEQTTATQTATAVEAKPEVKDVTKMDSATLEKVQEPALKEETPATQTQKTEQKTETPKPEPSEKEKQLEEALAKAQKQVTDKEHYIRTLQSQTMQQANVITDLKQKAQNLRTQANENFYVNPAESTRMVYQAERAEEEARGIEFRQQYDANRIAIAQFAPDYESLVPEIVEIITEKGYPKHLIDRFKADPYAEPVHVAVPFAEAAKMRKDAKEAREKLKAAQKGPEEIAKKIAETAQHNPGITASSGNATSQAAQDITPAAIRKMTRAQLDEYLAKTQ